MRGARRSPQLPVVPGTPETQERNKTWSWGLKIGNTVCVCSRWGGHQLGASFHLALKHAVVPSIFILEIKGNLHNIIAMSMHDVSLTSFYQKMVVFTKFVVVVLLNSPFTHTVIDGIRLLKIFMV